MRTVKILAAVILGIFGGLALIFSIVELFASKSIGDFITGLFATSILAGLPLLGVFLLFRNLKKDKPKSKPVEVRSNVKNDIIEPIVTAPKKPDYAIKYVDGSGNMTFRKITLEKIIDTGQGKRTIYLRAFCHDRGEIRTFKLSRVEQLTDLTTGEMTEDAIQFFKDRNMVTYDPGFQLYND